MSIDVTRMAANRGGFERLPNSAIRDARLSPIALGVLARLLVDGEQYDTIDQIADAYTPQCRGESRRDRGTGRDAYRKAARELEAAGYLVRTNHTGPGGLLRKSVAVYAESTNVPVPPATAQASSVPPGETGNDAGRTDDGLDVLGATGGNEVKPHVAPTTAEASSVSPAQTSVFPVRTDDGSGVVPPIQTINRPTDLLPPTPSEPSDGDASPLPEDGGGGDLVDDQPDEHTAAATALVGALPYDRRMPNGREYRDLVAYVDARAAERWPWCAACFARWTS